MKEIYAKYISKNMKSTFPIDASTTQISLKIKPNPSYDTDFDKDSIPNDKDNCKYASNNDQKDID
jgi:hypothetical protein